MSPILLLILFCLIAYYLYRYSKQRPHNFPPGPSTLPLWGSYWWVLFNNYKFPYKGFQKLAEKYKTKILGLHLGSFPTVVVSDYENVKQVLTRPEFQGRVQMSIINDRTYGKNIGVLFVDGPVWEEQRRFSLRYLRDYGLGRRFSSMENIIAEEIQDMVDLLDGRRKDEQLFSNGLAVVPDIFYPLFLNTLWYMFIGDRFHVSDSKLLKYFYNKAMRHQRSIEVTGGAVGLTPWLKYISTYFGYQDLVDSAKDILQIIDKAVTQQSATLSEDYNRSFVDNYIKEMNERKKTGEPSTFTEEQIRVLMMDYVLPGSTTPNAAMIFVVVFLLNHPEVQEKMQQQLDAVVGRDRLPNLDDRAKLPYIDAVLREAMRLRPVLPLSVGRKALEDTELGGYSIPKGTALLVNVWASQTDPEFWDDPLAFRPERFLDNEGNLLKKDCTFPFGGGKRLCTGETSSRHFMFMLLATLMQSYTMKGAPGQPLPTTEPDMSGILLTKKSFLVRFEPRT
ncbi:probable cytochrome P450 304a1 [Periplaneta americana]|uniref:probable cytochrome P450 304a1 n=1 Tax=Periplaneta americana TaxID=6978 RepID=UPI0037E9B2B2